MIGAVIISHGGIAESLVKAVGTITGEVEHIGVVSVENPDSTDKVRDELAKAVTEVNGGKGVIIFSDMFGGTPTNVALSLLKEGEVEVMTGVNLPVLIKFISHRVERPLAELAVELKEYGKESIVLAGDMLREKEKGKNKGKGQE
jgi:PTS system mannose-specific IIA component